MSDFGVWAMLAFWLSAIGGVLVAILWARSRSGRTGSGDSSHAARREDTRGQRPRR